MTSTMGSRPVGTMPPWLLHRETPVSWPSIL
ncbi:Uncharacterised protein [Mycobacterium tuberculosis]|nr:Uncharacterised protein [Mycobacterium tuberculosis]